MGLMYSSRVPFDINNTKPTTLSPPPTPTPRIREDERGTLLIEPQQFLPTQCEDTTHHQRLDTSRMGLCIRQRLPHRREKEKGEDGRKRRKRRSVYKGNATCGAHECLTKVLPQLPPKTTHCSIWRCLRRASISSTKCQVVLSSRHARGVERPEPR